MATLFKKKREEEMNIDLTPMLDVVFIMLIFFIVTATFVSEEGFLVNRPPATPPDQPDLKTRNIVFIVNETNEIWLDNRRIDQRSIRANIERIRAENPEARVIVRSHELANANTYVTIADQTAEAVSDPAFQVSLVTYN